MSTSFDSRRTPLVHARRLAATAALAAMGALGSAQTVYRATESANAGEIVNIVGADLGAAATVLVTPISTSGTSGAARSLDIVNGNDFTVQARLPLAQTTQLLALAVRTASGKTSSPVYVNRARATRLDAAEAAAGATVRMFGRNLALPGFTPTVSLTSGASTLSARITAYDENSLSFVVPAGAQIGASYAVKVSNGSGGVLGVSTADASLRVRSGGGDPLGLGVSWAPDVASTVYNVKSDSRLKKFAVGDGQSDDTAAIQAAIDLASKNGSGVVSLPAGTYLLGSKLVLRSGVVLRGASMKTTVLKVAAGFTPTNAPADGDWAIWLGSGAVRTGMADLTVLNAATSATPNGVLRMPSLSEVPAARFFLARVDVELNNGRPITLTGTGDVLIQGSTIGCTSLVNGPLYMASCKNALVRNNVVRYRTGRIQAQFAHNALFESNVVNRDATYSVPGATESGGIETSFANGMVLLRNSLVNVGLHPRTGERDTELILSQMFVPDFYDAGTVASASGTTLVAAGKSWPVGSWCSARPEHGGGENRSIVAIVDGRGIGQWRSVVGHTASSVTIDKGWDVAPNATSRFLITNWSSPQQYILENSLANSNVGILIYQGGCDTVVARNTLTNAGYIALRTDNRMAPTAMAGSGLQQNLAYNVDISGNVIQNTDGTRPAQILLASVLNSTGAMFGNMMLGTNVRGNTLVTGTPNLSASSYYGMGDTEGLWNSVNVWCAKNATYPLANVGVQFSGNVAMNLRSKMYNLNGAGLTAVSDGIAAASLQR